jgi:transposase
MSDRPPPRLRQADRTKVIPAMPLEDLLDSDHQARLVWDFCLGLDLSPLYSLIGSRVGGPGHPAIDPRIQIALWLYATLEGVGSARALARLCEEHNAFRWLAGGVSVNHHTLSDFRTGHVAFLDGLLTHSVALLREQDLVDLNRVAHDGMRVRASAGAASFHRKQTLEEHLAEATQQVERLKAELDDDPSAGSRRQAAARERAAEERQGRLKQALARMPEMEAKKKPDEKDKARVSSTDPEATVMKMADGGFRPAYNVQLATDCGSLAIVGAGVITTGSDMGQMTRMLGQIQGRFDARPAEALADGGFASLSDIEAAQGGGTTVYAPVPEPKKPKGPKEGGAAEAAGRPEPEKPTRDKHEPMPGDSEVIGAWRRRMGTEGAKEIYKHRAATIECVNAQTRNRGLLRFLVRGLEKVMAVVLWFAVAHNLACGIRLRAGRAVSGLAAA